MCYLGTMFVWNNNVRSDVRSQSCCGRYEKNNIVIATISESTTVLRELRRTMAGKDRQP